MDLSIELGGLNLPSPLIIVASEFGSTGNMIKEIAEKVPVAIITKTITVNPLPNTFPIFGDIGAGFLNNVPGTPFSAEHWFTKEIPVARDIGVPLIASIAGANVEEAISLAEGAAEAGADAIMIPTYCPNLPEIFSCIGVDFQLPEFDQVDPFLPLFDAIKKAVDLPVFVKLSALFHPAVPQWAEKLDKAGCDGIAISDSFGPCLAIDIKTGQPLLGGPRGFAALTGKALKPIALRMVFEAVAHTDMPIIGVGGITTWKDAVEYIMAGASAFGVASSAHLQGTKQFTKILQGLENYMKEQNHQSLNDFRGITQKLVKERQSKGWHMVLEGKPPIITLGSCTGCNRCVEACIYSALSLIPRPPGVSGSSTKVVHLDLEKCTGCGLCYSRCKVDAISTPYFND